MDLAELAAAAFTLLLALGSLAGSIFLVVRARRFRASVERELCAPQTGFAPQVTLLVPVRGEFEELEANLAAILSLAYPELEFVLTVDSRDGALFGPLEALALRLAPGRAKVVAVDDRPPVLTASGKCAAQLRALEEVRPTSDVFVFADDDIRPPPDWIGHLVQPLSDERVAVATAYRWYFAAGDGLASHIRSAWNLVGLQIMFEDKWNFAWGGGMAMRRTDFEKWRIADGWSRAISDDYVVTVEAKRDGRPIRFVPRALAPSHETVGFARLRAWCRRQVFMTRIYDPALWKYAVAPYLFFNSLMLAGAFALAAAALGFNIPPWALLASLAFVLHFPLNLVKASLYYGAVRRMLPAQDAALRALFPGYLAGAALAPFVMVDALFAVRGLSVIEWRGRKYEVSGPLDVRPL